MCRIAFFDDSFWFVLAVSAIGDAGPFVQLGVLNGISVGDEGWHGVTGHALCQRADAIENVCRQHSTPQRLN